MKNRLVLLIVAIAVVSSFQCAIQYNYATLRVVNKMDSSLVIKAYFIDNSGDPDSQGIVVKPIAASNEKLSPDQTEYFHFTWLNTIEEGFVSLSWGLKDSTPNVYDFMINGFYPIVDGQTITIEIDGTDDFTVK